MFMVLAIIALPILALTGPSNRDFVLYAFYFCGLLELIGLTFVLVHIIKLKKTHHDQAS